MKSLRREEESARFLTSARAIASRCCWPPESKTTFVADHRFITVRLGDDEIVRISGPRCRVNFFRRRIEPAELDVFENGVVKQKCFLRNQADLFAQRFLCQRAQIVIVDFDCCRRSDRRAAK